MRNVLAQFGGLTFYTENGSPIISVESSDGSLIAMMETVNGGINVSVGRIAQEIGMQNVTPRTNLDGTIHGFRIERAN